MYQKARHLYLVMPIFRVGVVVLLFFLFFPVVTAWAGNGEYQRCETGTTCKLGEFLYDDSYSTISGATCTLTSRNPSGQVFLNNVSMTGDGHGWYSADVDTTGQDEGLYPSQMCCTTGSDHMCLDKSFMIGPSFSSVSDISNGVWSNPARTLTSLGSLAADVWSYSARSLTTLGSLASDVWSSNTRTLTSNTLTSGSLATTATVQSATTSIKGADNKDLTQVAGQVAGVQDSVDSLDDKVVALDSKTTTISTNLDTVLTKWDSYSMSDVIGYVDDVRTRLGANTDTCDTNDTVFGNIQCVQDQWGNVTATDLYTQANNIQTVSNALRTELGFNGKSTTAYQDLQHLKTSSDNLESLVGTSADPASTATIFGRMQHAQETIETLDTSAVDVSGLLAKWGSFSAADIYGKVKDLSAQIEAANTVNNVSSLVSMSQTSQDNDKEVKNKLLELQAVIDINHQLLEKTTNKPVIESWMEEGSIIFKTLIANPSAIVTQKVPLKYYLPKELSRENIIDMDPQLTLEYDPDAGALYVSGTFELAPKETRTFSVHATDIWQLSDTEISSLRQQTSDLSKPLNGTSYFAQGSTLKSDINVSLDKAQNLMQEAHTPEERIKSYREAEIEVDGANRKIDDLKTLVSSAGSINTLTGFVGGVQTLAVWGIVVILICGFSFMAFYMRALRPVPPKTEPPVEKATAKSGGHHLSKKILPAESKSEPELDEPGANSEVRHHRLAIFKDLGKFKRLALMSSGIAIVIFLVGAGVVIARAAKLKLPSPLKTNSVIKNAQALPSILPSSVPTATTQPAIPTPSAPPKKLVVLPNPAQFLNMREGDGINFDLVAKIDIGTELTELDREKNAAHEEWVEVQPPQGESGWVLAKYVGPVTSPISDANTNAIPTKEAAKVADGKQVLGATTPNQNNVATVVVDEGVSGVNVRQEPGGETKIVGHITATQPGEILDKKSGWIKLRFAALSADKTDLVGWVSEAFIK